MPPSKQCRLFRLPRHTLLAAGLFAIVRIERFQDVQLTFVPGIGAAGGGGGGAEALDLELGIVEDLLAALGHADALFVEKDGLLKWQLAALQRTDRLVEPTKGLFEGERLGLERLGGRLLVALGR